MTWVRRGSTVLAAVLGLLLLGGSVAWAQEAETDCTGGETQTDASASGGSWRYFGPGQSVTCSITTAGTVTLNMRGNGAVSFTVFLDSVQGETVANSLAWPTPYTVTVEVATVPAQLVLTRNAGYPILDSYTVAAPPVPSPSPESSPEPSPSAPEPTATPAAPATSTATCGTQEEPCVTVLDEQQYLGLALMTGTLLLVALTNFLLRHGRALRV